MQRIYRAFSRAALFAPVVLAAGCASTPSPKKLSAEEQIRQDVVVGAQVAESFEAKLKIRRDPELSVYLRKLGSRMAEGAPELKNAPLGVLVIEDRDAKWANYSLPGNRVYLSAGWLKKTDFENEIAAAIAVEFGHIVGRHAVIRLTRNPEVARLESSVIESVMPVSGPDGGRVNVDFFGPGGIFGFSAENHLNAAETAVDLMYRAGFDPRGLISFWNRYAENPAHSPLDPGLLQQLIERSRTAIAQRAPLRNPIVRSKEFLALKKRIERL